MFRWALFRAGRLRLGLGSVISGQCQWSGLGLGLGLGLGFGLGLGSGLRGGRGGADLRRLLLGLRPLGLLLVGLRLRGLLLLLDLLLRPRCIHASVTCGQYFCTACLRAQHKRSGRTGCARALCDLMC